MKKAVIIALAFFCSLSLRAQSGSDSCTMEISLLTCAPGTDLYSIFGHTAIRVRDTSRGMDIVYNYGFFDDTDPMFYVHFTKGIMRYSVNAETFANFMTEYEYEHRDVKEQVLHLNCAESKKLYEFLRTNTQEENRFYNYHFHTDNCTTRAGRAIEANTLQPLKYANVLPPGAEKTISFRDMIHEYLDKQQAYWPELGIDFCLGKNLDLHPTNLEAIHFLPDYLYRGLDQATEGSKAVVLQRKNVIQFPETNNEAVWFTPLRFFLFILLLITILSFLKKTPVLVKSLFLFDIIFFTMLGLVGLLISYLWLGRVDDVCRDNINICWAIPFHIIAVFFLRSKRRWTKYYFLMTFFLSLMLLIGFPWWTQRMNLAVLPILGIVLIRTFFIFQKKNNAEKFPVQRRTAGI
jgi:Domain of unknown function (DUF4105)